MLLALFECPSQQNLVSDKVRYNEDDITTEKITKGDDIIIDFNDLESQIKGKLYHNTVK